MPFEHTPNVVAYAILAAWAPLSCVLYWRLRPALATALTIVLGRLFLPERIGFPLPLVPDLDKQTIPIVCAVLGCVFTARRQFAQARPLRGVDLWILPILIGDLGTMLTNLDPVVADPPRPGLTGYLMAEQICEDVVVVYGSFLAGRAMFRTDDQVRSLLQVLFGAALLYVPFCLFEFRMGPQTNLVVYEFLQYPYDPRMRATGGFRPVVFFDDAMTLARFMLCAVMAGAVLLRSRSLRPLWVAPFGGLLTVFVLLRSAGAFLLGLVMLPLCAFAKARTQLRVAWILAVLVGLYPLLRCADLFPQQALLDAAEKISADRADSTAVRFDNENDLLNKARERALFGWGGHGRAHIYDPDTGEDISVIDTEWIALVTTRGLAGYLGWYALYLIPIFTAARNARRIGGPTMRLLLSGMALMVVVLAIETIFKSSGSWPHFFFAGALHGATHGILRQDRLARLRMCWGAPVAQGPAAIPAPQVGKRA